MAKRKIAKRRITKRRVPEPSAARVPKAGGGKVGPIIDRPQLKGVSVGGCEVTAEALTRAGFLAKDKRWARKVKEGLPSTERGTYTSTSTGKPNRALLASCPYCGEKVWLVRTVKHRALYTAFCGNSGKWLWMGAKEKKVRGSATEAGYGLGA